jgi:hypothetical protein
MNIHPETGIAYGYISARALDPELVTDLLDNGVNHSAEEAFKVWRATEIDMLLDCDPTLENQEEAEAAFEEQDCSFWDAYEDYEPLISGRRDGVKYITSWLGGALNFFITESPHVTDKARLASPCVPNAGILDTLDGSVESYDVPTEWRYVEE